VKWLILAVVVILAAPTVAKRLEMLDPEKREQAASDAAEGRRRGLFYRSVRRFGPRKVFIGFVVILVILAVVAYLLVRQI
jgi:hypothetical protein